MELFKQRKRLMILGTSSGAGKSTLVTGLCRILTNQGQRVAPFKAQNMSNNGYVLADGKELAKSQVIAAVACKREPQWQMNPVLLKLRDHTFDVIFQGELLGQMSRADFRQWKWALGPTLVSAFEDLCQTSETILMEGAGSPVEMNMKDEDIVNMSMALSVQAPVILVADIDRGGAFAAVVGTLALLTKEELGYVKGIIINRLRGDEHRFQEIAYAMEKVTGLPVLGVVPYLPLWLEDEDGLIDPATGRKGPLEGPALEEELDRFAKELEPYLAMEKIQEILDEGVLS